MKYLLVGILTSISIISAQRYVTGQEATPKPIPNDRVEMLKALDQLKSRTPRLPLDPVAAEEAAGNTGSLGVVNNGRMRAKYLPEELKTDRKRQEDPNMVFPYDFSVEMFWLVSRINNCHYCLGHQEVKLEKAGVDEQCRLDLDTDWSKFDSRHREAFAFTRKLTMEPQSVTLQDVQKLREHFSDLEILEIAYLVGRYNSTNRWTDSLGIPQEDHRDFTSLLNGTSKSSRSVVVRTEFDRRELPSSSAEWQEEIASRSNNQTWLTGLKLETPDDLAHVKLLRQFPVAGQQFLAQLEAAESNGAIDPKLRPLIMLACAFEDKAVYVQKLALDDLQEQGQTLETLFKKLNPAEDSASAEALAIQFCRKLTSSPQLMTDDDIQRLTKVFSPQEIAEIVYRVGLAAQLNRITLTAGLGSNR